MVKTKIFFPWWLKLKCRRPGFNPWVGKIPWKREWQPTPVFFPEDFHGQRSLAGYSSWRHKELDTTEQHLAFFRKVTMIVWCALIHPFQSSPINIVLPLLYPFLWYFFLWISWVICIHKPLRVCVFSHSFMFDSATPRTVAHQAPFSMGFSRQEYWSELPCLPPEYLPNPGIEPMSHIYIGRRVIYY